MQSKSTVFASILIASVSGCSSQPEPTESEFKVRSQQSTVDTTGSFNQSRTPVFLTDTKAIAFAKSPTIPWRSQHYSMESLLDDDRVVARPMFRRYADDEAKQRLVEAYATFFGSKSQDSFVERNKSLSLKVEGGSAWIARDSGALTLRKPPGKREVSELQDAHEAVQIAARELGKLGLWQLAEDVTLDIIDVSATMSTSWDPQPDGTFSAVPVRHPLTGKDVNQYISKHMVIFGRRYKGIPIEGGTLKAVIDAHGNLISALQEWREITGEADEGIAIDPVNTIEGRRDPRKAELQLDTRVCAYFETSFVGYTQDSPGVGCLYRSIVPGASGMGRVQTDLVSMTSDTAIPLNGRRIGVDPQP